MEYKEFEHGIVYLGNSEELLEKITGYDHVLSDPPYGYLKHRIETFFDYRKVFDSIRKNIKPKGGILLFGRGDLFYEWNLYLRDIGFIHKEDCALIKNNPSAVLLAMPRQTEYYTIRGLDGFTINKVNIPITDKENIKDCQIADCLRGIRGSKKSKEFIIEYLETGKVKYDSLNTRENVSIDNISVITNRGIGYAKFLVEGRVLTTALNSSRELLDEGSHPTIKPSKELGYLIKAISNKGQTILDPFLGSGSTAIACINTNRRFIGIELDPQYYELTCKRIENHYANFQPLLFDINL